MAAVVEFLDTIAEQGQGSPFLGWAQDAVIASPQGPERLRRQGVAAAGEATGPGEPS